MKGDRWRFDYLLCIAALLDVVTFWIEATAKDFWTLAMAFIIGGQTMQAIVFGYCLQTLPLYYVQQYQLKFIQFYLIGALIGPATGGILSHFFSFRLVFYIAAMLASILFIFCMIRIRGTRDIIFAKQLEFESLYYETIDIQEKLKNKIKISETKKAAEEAYKGLITDDMKWLVSNDYKFPCLISKTKILRNTISPSSVEHTHESEKPLGLFEQLKTVFGQFTKYRLFVMMSFIIMQAIAQMGETSIVTWFTVCNFVLCV